MSSKPSERVAIRNETATRLRGIAMTAGGPLVRVSARFAKPLPLAVLFCVISIAAILIDNFEPAWFPGHREAAALVWLLALTCLVGVLASRDLLRLVVLLVNRKSPLLPVVLASVVAVALVSAIPGSRPTWLLHLALWFVSCYAPVFVGIDTEQWGWKKTALQLTIWSCALDTLLVVPAFPLIVEVWILFFLAVLAVLAAVREVAVGYGLMLIVGSAVTLLLGRADVDFPAAAGCMLLLVLFAIIYAPSLIWIRSRLAKDRWRMRTYCNRTRTGLGPQQFV